MKRILSILLSVTIVASMLVSMSVTSFAFDKVLYTDTTPSADTTLEITVEKGDATVIENTGLENPYVITFTLDNYGTLNAWKASNKQNGTRLPGVEIGFTFTEDGAPADPDSIWWYADESTEIGTEDVTIYDPETLEYDFGFGKPVAAAYPVGTTGGVLVTDPIVMKFVFATMPSDTFRINIGTKTTYIAYTFQDYSSGNNNGPKRVVGLASSPQTTVPIEFPTTLYVKDGVQVTEDEYYGSSAPTEYTVTFKNGDSVLQSATVVEGAAVTAPEAPTAPVDADPAYNYTFVGWSDGSNTYASNEIPVATDNVEYTAVFNSVKKTYTITFNVDGATTTQTVEYGVTPSYAGTPSKEGYTFTGWDKDFAPATADTTYTAQFAIKTYTITFIVDGVTSTKTVNHGETPDYGSTPSKAGYNFTGWTPAIVPATGAATYTAQFDLIPPTKYEITFVVDGVETKVETIEGQTPVYPNGTPAKDGFNFTGWDPAIAPATANATYTAQFEEIIPAGPAVEITTVDRIDTDIFPGSTLPEVEVSANGKTHTVSAARLHRVHTTFDYDASAGTLKEMGMLFVPKAVAGSMSKEEIIAAGIAKDANCNSLPAEITGGTTGVVFKAGLVDVPAEFKGITIYAIPYYTLSGGTREYHGIIETTF